MYVFVTGATGWVGSAVVKDLIQAGHEVYGLARSPEKAGMLADSGMRVVQGTLDDLDLLTRTAERCDAVIHTAFDHDFSRFVENAEQDRRAIHALAAGLTEGGRRLIVTSGVAVVSPGRVITEDMSQEDRSHPRQSEQQALIEQQSGVQVSAVRLAPSVHGRGDKGFVPLLIDLARRTGVSAYIGEGNNRWPAVHRLDAARLYRLILETAQPRFAYHGVAEQGIPFKDLATAIGRGLGLPVEARSAEHFGWFARFAGGDFPASNKSTREILGWSPQQPGLLADLDGSEYFQG
ncbi:MULTISPECIES: SDR family oxidoreductase [Pseudomonas]|jgi:nucleoside-diphosphate-sugar epimerase|uniref:SDR family oxidoreductase n=1 Tax=Pseudomonas TaxID=286 RepID=UPI0007744CE7|nr:MULTISPECIES: SDR family oxidoreductase [Pseudomonas]KXK69704.1 3-beta hydroxysteroid dehydrogenase [Pseudomonas monteilii]MBS9761875.1 SDR family oxidoreductase [Pseudomonas mosselii]WPU59482.1 SDR family oxidoreductase [Pseudomonas asiatica]